MKRMGISETDIEFLSQQENWCYGPMYEVWLYFSPECSPELAESTIIKAAELTSWNAVKNPRLLKTILCVDGLVPIGLVHSYTHPKAPTQDFASHCVAIYPPQYIRALGGHVNGELDPEFEMWQYLDPGRVRLFHQALFDLVHKFAQIIPLIGASINTEDRGIAHPYTRDGSICISPNVARIIGLETTAIPESYGFFVSIRPDVR